MAVIIPTFDREQRVLRAVASVLDQSLSPAELVVVDDGSSDRTRDLLQQRFPNSEYPELHVLGYDDPVPRNRGVSAARNRGIRVTRSPWLAFLDSDDEWHPKKLELQVEALEQIKRSDGASYRICHCNETWIRDGRRVEPRRRHRKASGWDFEHCLDLCAISPSAVMIERDLLDEVGVFDQTFPACEDYDLWLRISHREPVLLLEEALVTKYGGHADQLSKAHVAMDRFRIRAIEKLLDEPTLLPEQRKSAIEELRRKLGVFRAGSVKRGLVEQTQWCDEILLRLDPETGSP